MIELYLYVLTNGSKQHGNLLILILIFFIQAEPYIGITPGCAASESGVTSPELLIMFPYDNLERF